MASVIQMLMTLGAPILSSKLSVFHHFEVRSRLAHRPKGNLDRRISPGVPYP